jgi:hypothetical protein
MTKTVLGVFHDRNGAEDAIDELRDRDYNPKDISIVMRNREEAKEVADNTGAGVASGAATGATTGAVVGGLAGLLAAVALPGLGAFLIGGPIAAALGLTGAAASTVSGAATGAVAGGLLGALTGLGLSEDDARVYQDYVNEGGILIAVPARRGEETEVRDVLDEFGADQIRTISPSDDTVHRSRRDDTYERGSFFAGAKGGRRSVDDRDFSDDDYIDEEDIPRREPRR